MLLHRRLVALLLVVLSAAPALAQGRNERWVATWATALVARAQPGPGRGQGPGGPTAPAVPPAANPPAANPPAPAAVAPSGGPPATPPAGAPPAGARQGGPGGQPAVT